jgi:hypothetical protein
MAKIFWVHFFSDVNLHFRNQRKLEIFMSMLTYEKKMDLIESLFQLLSSKKAAPS